jgi:hypothetical protein
MTTRFTLTIERFNNLINKFEVGSDRYRFLCSEKYKYIQEF